MKSVISICILSMSLPLMAQVSTNNEGLCKQLQEARQQMKEQKLPKLDSMRFKLIIQKIFPSLSYDLNSVGGPLPSEKKSVGGRHLIVTFGVPLRDEKIKKEFENAQAEMKRQTKLFIRLFRQKNQQKCLAEANRIGFDAKAFSEIQKVIGQMDEAQRDKEYGEVLKRYHKIPRKLREQWEIKTGFHAADLKALLSTNSVDHLIIVAHANAKGHLTDSFDNYLPNGFFQDIDSKLKSLSFFTCHGKKVIESFHLQNSKKLNIFFPEAKSPLLGDVTILPALPSFVKKISSHLLRLNTRKNKISEVCSLEIKAGKIEAGEISFLLGDKYFLGHFQNGKAKSYPFNCSLLKDENMVSIRSLRQNLSFNLIKEWNLKIKTPEGESKLELIDHFQDKEKQYQGSLYTIL